MKYTKTDLKAFKDTIESVDHILLLQPERLDADSLGSALALGDIFAKLGKKVTHYCYSEVPTYLHHMCGWEQIGYTMPTDFDATILVDSATKNQLERTFSEYKDLLSSKPFIVIDHHNSRTGEIDFATLSLLDDKAGASSQQVVELAENFGWEFGADSAYVLAAGIKADTVNLSTAKTSPETLMAMAKVVEVGADLEQLRLNIEKTSSIPVEQLPLRIKYLERAKFYHHNKVVFTYFTLEEYESLGLDKLLIEQAKNDLRMLEEVDISVTITLRKNYANASMRANVPVANLVAEYFGGGGHDKAASCRFFDMNEEQVAEEMLPVLIEKIEDYYKNNG